MGEFERAAYFRRAKVEALKSYGGSAWDQQFVGHTLKDDLAMFGLTEMPGSEDELTAAFRTRVKALSYMPGVDMDDVKKARDRLRQTLEHSPQAVNHAEKTACKLCGGSGRIGTGFGQSCPSCKGTGQTS